MDVDDLVMSMHSLQDSVLETVLHTVLHTASMSRSGMTTNQPKQNQKQAFIAAA